MAAKKLSPKSAQSAKSVPAASAAVPRIDLAQALQRLAVAIPKPVCEIDHKDPWTLLIGTILSAQSTDKMINTVTPGLFAKWPSPKALAAAPRAEVEQAVFRTGFFRNKAKAIQECSQMLVDRHGGVVPRTMEELLELPGVARKTANVVLGVGYRIPAGIVVDTHMTRLAARFGLSTQKSAEKIERDLCAALPKDQWLDGGARIQLHGRYVCLAKDPQCASCPLFEVCPSRAGEPQGSWQVRAERERQLVESRGETR